MKSKILVGVLAFMVMGVFTTSLFGAVKRDSPAGKFNKRIAANWPIYLKDPKGLLDKFGADVELDNVRTDFPVGTSAYVENLKGRPGGGDFLGLMADNTRLRLFIGGDEVYEIRPGNPGEAYGWSHVPVPAVSTDESYSWVFAEGPRSRTHYVLSYKVTRPGYVIEVSSVPAPGAAGPVGYKTAKVYVINIISLEKVVE